MSKAAPSSYKYVDFSDWDPNRGGPTPSWSFSVVGDMLGVSIDDDCYDVPDLPSHAGAIGRLQSRLYKLKHEAELLEAFLDVAKVTTTVGIE